MNLNKKRRRSKELEELQQRKLGRSRIRSRTKWVSEGERVTNYFCNLNNRNISSKSMNSLQTMMELLKMK